MTLLLELSYEVVFLERRDKRLKRLKIISEAKKLLFQTSKWNVTKRQ